MKLLALILVLATSAVRAADKVPSSPALASWYIPRTNGMFCATWHYPIGTRLRVTELHNRLSVIVTVIERGPHRRLHRQIDLSWQAFEQIDGLALGIAEVKIERVK